MVGPSGELTGVVGGVGALGGLDMKNEDSLLQSTHETQDGLLQTIEHEPRSTGPNLVPLLATGCLYLGGYI